jgi:hypothetical protein
LNLQLNDKMPKQRNARDEEIRYLRTHIAYENDKYYTLQDQMNAIRQDRAVRKGKRLGMREHKRLEKRQLEIARKIWKMRERLQLIQ